MATEEKIRELAYAIWEQEGRPDGKDVEHYFRAKLIVEQQEAAAQFVPPMQPKEIAAPKPPPELPDKKRKGPAGRRGK